MFGAAGLIPEYIRAKTLPSRDVTEAEFRRACRKAGWKKDAIDQGVKLSRIMGSHVLVGDEKLRVKPAKGRKVAAGVR